jgi:quinol monooxygenase YgiN
MGDVTSSLFKRRLSFAAFYRIRRGMLVVHVHVQVKPEHVDAFKQATLANARESLKEPGVMRFDVVQQQDDPTHFVLIEVYRDATAAAAHKETAHYPVWRDTVAPMMAEPRQSVKFNNVFPDDANW